jgi:hypothetical protein
MGLSNRFGMAFISHGFKPAFAGLAAIAMPWEKCWNVLEKKKLL